VTFSRDASAGWCRAVTRAVAALAASPPQPFAASLLPPHCDTLLTAAPALLGHVALMTRDG
jgi:hypothetical protein